MRELIPFNSFKISSLDMVSQMSLRYNADVEDNPKKLIMVPILTNSVSPNKTLNFYKTENIF